jgi:hypothetical protein
MDMMVCERCGQPATDRVLVCKCGEQLPAMLALRDLLEAMDCLDDIFLWDHSPGGQLFWAQAWNKRQHSIFKGLFDRKVRRQLEESEPGFAMSKVEANQVARTAFRFLQSVGVKRVRKESKWPAAASMVGAYERVDRALNRARSQFRSG